MLQKGVGSVSAHPYHRQVRARLHLPSSPYFPGHRDERQSLFHLQLLIRTQPSAIAPMCYQVTAIGTPEILRSTQPGYKNLKRLGSARSNYNSLLRHRKEIEYRDCKDGKLKTMLPRLT